MKSDQVVFDVSIVKQLFNGQLVLFRFAKKNLRTIGGIEHPTFTLSGSFDRASLCGPLLELSLTDEEYVNWDRKACERTIEFNEFLMTVDDVRPKRCQPPTIGKLGITAFVVFPRGVTDSFFVAFSRLGNELRAGRRAGWFGDRRERILQLCGCWLQNVNGDAATMRSSPIAPVIFSAPPWPGMSRALWCGSTARSSSPADFMNGPMSMQRSNRCRPE